MRLIEKGVLRRGGLWVDLGAGSGAFTLALRELAGEDVEILAVDTDNRRLEELKAAFARQFPGSRVRLVVEDFTRELALPIVDGVLMANSLHYVEEPLEMLLKVKGFLKPGGRLVLVEYNAEVGNRWVPYPVAWERFRKLAMEAGFEQVDFLNSVPSDFLQEIYAGVAVKSSKMIEISKF